MNYLKNNTIQYSTTCLKYISFILIGATLLSSCEKCAFKKTKTGLYYKIEEKGSGPRPKNDEVLSLTIRYQTKGNEVIFNSDTLTNGMPINAFYRDQLTKGEEGNVGEGIHMLQKGDKMICKIPAKKLLGDDFTQLSKAHKLEEETPIYVHLHLQDVIDRETFNKQQQEKHNEMMEKRKQQDKIQLPKDLQAIRTYLTANKIKALSTPSGLHYSIVKPGQGAHPIAGQIVHVNYIGKTLEGQIVDTSFPELAKAHHIYNEKRNYGPLIFKVGEEQIIPGLTEGVQLTRKGGKTRLFIPSTLAFRNMELDNIKPHSNLVFDIELVEIEG
jgi:FKBP-type peptidyl-prolyl cis-trans isomerase FkpA